MDRDSRLSAQLAPLEAALMASAREQAGRHLDDAGRTAEAATAEGAAGARAVLERAAAEGRRAAERAAAHRLVDGRRQARGLVLAARNTAYRGLIAEAVAAAEALRGRSAYGELERRLTEIARELLGADATIVRDPDGQGGVQARHEGRTVDLTLATLARRCVERLGQEVTRLWA